MKVINTPVMRARKSSISYNKKRNTEVQGSLHRQIKEHRKKVGYAAIFTDSTRRGAFSEEASIHTAEMTVIKTAMKGIKEREDIRCVIYKDSLRPSRTTEKITQY